MIQIKSRALFHLVASHWPYPRLVLSVKKRPIPIKLPRQSSDSVSTFTKTLPTIALAIAPSNKQQGMQGTAVKAKNRLVKFPNLQDIQESPDIQEIQESPDPQELSSLRH